MDCRLELFLSPDSEALLDSVLPIGRDTESACIDVERGDKLVSEYAIDRSYLGPSDLSEVVVERAKVKALTCRDLNGMVYGRYLFPIIRGSVEEDNDSSQNPLLFAKRWLSAMATPLLEEDEEDHLSDVAIRMTVARFCNVVVARKLRLERYIEKVNEWNEFEVKYPWFKPSLRWESATRCILSLKLGLVTRSVPCEALLRRNRLEANPGWMGLVALDSSPENHSDLVADLKCYAAPRMKRYELLYGTYTFHVNSKDSLTNPLWDFNARDNRAKITSQSPYFSSNHHLLAQYIEHGPVRHKLREMCHSMQELAQSLHVADN